ncbi:hypothetical protein OG824_48145 [Streptomyces prunicolor]|uniref:hypothetical protein n=1 Tax=Streptomyces prunicolor TaxID=67348 RepID=UPI0022583E82|nr:hypothetical protein [Streptomyces prunicolor]MCX5242996.1 hypothetical protein [Streptomyces prunicolor]
MTKPLRHGVQRYRVAQWTTGNIGARTMRAVLEHPNLTLAGVYVHTPAKAGLDTGELSGVGFDATGVLATHDIDEILALGADCALHTPHDCDFGEVCTLLSPGVNVVSTRGEFHHARATPGGLRDNFGPSLRLLAKALSVPLDSVEAVGEVATARHPT